MIEPPRGRVAVWTPERRDTPVCSSVMDEWIHLSIELPPDDGRLLLLLLKEKLGFTEIDFCELQRPDHARVGYGPCEPRTDSGYTLDPFS